MKEVEAIDEALLRKLLNAHSKTPSFFYLETGALSLMCTKKGYTYETNYDEE